MPREITRHCFHYITGDGILTGNVLSTNYKVSPIPAGDLEISLFLRLSVEQKRIREMMKDYVGKLCDYNYFAQEANNNQTDDDSDNEIIVSVE